MGITKELNKESLIHSYTIYTTYTWFVLIINNPILKSMYHSWIYYKVDIISSSPFYNVLGLWHSYYVIYHITTVMCLFIVQEIKETKNKIKRKIKSRKIDKKKRKSKSNIKV